MAGAGVIHHFVREEDPVQRIHAEREQCGGFVRSDQSLSRMSRQDSNHSEAGDLRFPGVKAGGRIDGPLKPIDLTSGVLGTDGFMQQGSEASECDCDCDAS
jgi:hypothetical protein